MANRLQNQVAWISGAASGIGEAVARLFAQEGAAVGLADVTANALFAFAAGHALLSLVSVLGSLYPVVTVLLAHVILGERLTRTQKTGVAAALAGVAAIASG